MGGDWPGEMRYSVVDVMGREVMFGKNNTVELSTELDVSGFASGMYFIKYGIDNKVKSFKFIKE